VFFKKEKLKMGIGMEGWYGNWARGIYIYLVQQHGNATLPIEDTFHLIYIYIYIYKVSFLRYKWVYRRTW
jgi:hypothetical protein